MNLYLDERHPDADESVLFLHGGNVAGWMWEGQVAALPGHHCLVPDLPGMGGSADHPWTDLAATADALADVVRERAHGGRAHVVGLSLGGIVGIVLAARHPDVVRSVFVTGALLCGVRGPTRWAGLAQLPFWGSPGYWKGLARAYGLPAESVDVFVRTGLGIDRGSARRTVAEIYDGGPALHLDGLRGLDVPVLTIAGERELRTLRDSLDEVTRRVPHAVARVAPRMHHVWSIEDPELFHTALSHWLRTGEPSPALLPLAPVRA